MLQAAGALQIVVEYAHARDTVRLAHAVEDLVDDLAEVVAVPAHARGASIGERAFLRFGRLEHLDRCLVPAALLEVTDGGLDLQYLVCLGVTFGAFDAGGHRALDDDCSR